MLVTVPEICDEEKLVYAVRNGDEAAFETMYTRYAPALMRYSAMILKDEDAAYETVQDTFVSVWMNRRMLNPQKSIRNYLLLQSTTILSVPYGKKLPGISENGSRWIPIQSHTSLMNMKIPGMIPKVSYQQ